MKNIPDYIGFKSTNEGYADDAFETDWVQMQNNAKGLGGRPKGSKEIEIKSKDLKGTLRRAVVIIRIQR